MRSTLPLDEQVALLMRGVTYGDPQTEATMTAELRQRLAESLETGRPLRVYLGVDPTSTDLHLGHTVPLRKLRQFQDLGHEVIFLIGSFTALIGDPSDKDSARTQQTPEQVEANARTYVEQVYRVLDRDRTIIEYNHRWLASLDFSQLIELGSHFTVQQFLARDNFARRHAKGDPIWLHEFFYALMQAYDAVALHTDVQVGGTEQLFNLMAGRKLMEARGMRPQICITLPILVGTDGHARMSKSMGNTIGIAEPPETQYGKVMSLPDHAMRSFFELVTRWTPAEIDEIFAQWEAGQIHPRDVKMRLAFEIVEIFHGTEAAHAAEEHFRTVFQRRELPSDMPTYTLTEPIGIVDLLVESGLTTSKSQARRLIAQGAVRLDGEVIDDIGTLVAPRSTILQVGRRRFLQIVPANA
ncbi:MAG TPA: tyrosine--tRNA ligase [Chloroflexi bacterium]|jgi:tyrosyl-tRNA synthetase|nr:tyrosine--tRNA ligase [Chloroflexota bacterium]